jgi:hypothetical protein
LIEDVTEILLLEDDKYSVEFILEALIVQMTRKNPLFLTCFCTSLDCVG